MQPAVFKDCQCINTALWHELGSEITTINMTAARCVAHCQSYGTTYVQASPRADGKCWCANSPGEILHNGTSGSCTPQCVACPGAPITACGTGHTVAIYEW